MQPLGTINLTILTNQLKSQQVESKTTKVVNQGLIGQLNDDIKQIFQSIADGSDFEIEVMETDKDHIHFLIRYIPRLSISQMVRRLKQESTRQIWLLHPILLRQEYWYQQIFWSDGYFVCSIGEANPNTIKQYILTQG